MDTVRIKKDFTMFAGKTDKFSYLTIWFLGFSALDKINSVEKTKSSNITNNFIFLIKFLQSFSEVLTNNLGMLLKSIFLDDF